LNTFLEMSTDDQAQAQYITERVLAVREASVILPRWPDFAKLPYRADWTVGETDTQ